MVKSVIQFDNTKILYENQQNNKIQPPSMNQTNIAVPKTSDTSNARLYEHAQTQETLAKAIENHQQDIHKEPLPGSIEGALAELNKKMRPWATGLRFDVDPDLDRLVISIIDNENGEVLRSIPSEVLLQVAKMITSFQGQGVDTQA